MANAKSNIYPIQLQGAELCLNRYDAEIKQYSGFNKNNSPFVGGCLSNIFTKDEVISDARKNVYIDENGTVYQIKNLRFYKNNKPLRRIHGKYVKKDYLPNFSSTSISLTNDKFIARYFDEDLYLIRNTNKNNVAIVGYYLKTGTSYLDLNDVGLYDIDYEDYETNNFTAITFTYNEKKYYVFAAHNSSSTLKLYLFLKNEDGTYTRKSSISKTVSNNNLIKKVVLGYNHNQVYIVYTSSSRKMIDFYSFDEANGLTLLAENINNISSISSEISSLDKYEFCNYPLNTGYLNLDNTDSNIEPGTAFKPVLMMKGLYYNNGTIAADTLYKTSSNIWGISTFDADVRLSMSNNGVNTPLLYVRDLSFKVKVNSDSQYDKGVAVHFNSDDFTTFGLSFNVTGVTAEGENKIGRYVFGDVVDISVFSLLFNNNFLSGFSIDGTLLTEWNSNISVGSIFINLFDIFFKLNDNWIKISRIEGNSIATLKRVENQLVYNECNAINSFDIKRNKFLRFAPAFNMCITAGVSNKHTTFFYDLTDIIDNTKIAAAINEYTPEDNPSIILNPVTFYNPIPSFSEKDYKLVYHNEYDVINFYVSGMTENLIYSFSRKKNNEQNNFFVRSNLFGLPYPIDSNGNVQYSPSILAEFFSSFGNEIFVKEGDNAYQLSKYNNQPIMAYYLGTLVEGLEDVFILQGQYYGIINNQIFSIQFYNGVVANQTSVVSVQGLQFCGNTPYEALFFSKTNRCLYSFTGANILSIKQFIDKIDVVKSYKYNPATQSIFLLTDIGVIVSSLFGIYQIEMPEAEDMFLLDNGIVLTDNLGNYRYVRYYKENTDDTYLKHNIKLETCFYGMNNQTVTINDCLYMRIFSEEHEQGNLEVSATTLSLKGRKTEKTVFRIKASDWDKETNTIYLRYQPKEQRGLGISFSINSPFKIAALSVGSQTDAILVDKVSKGAINAPSVTSNNLEW